MDASTDIILRRFQPRDYQKPIIAAIEKKGYKRVLVVLPRRAGKDIVALNILLRAALMKPGVYYYVFPTYAQARKIIWKSLTSDGQRFLDYIPRELIDNINSQEMCIILKNKSIIQLLGSDNYDSLVGTNPSAIVYSEYAIQDPNAHQFLSPALKYNQGWALFISTPRGKSHMYELWNIAKANPGIWFPYLLTVEETKHIDIEEIEREIASGEISRDLALQEYWCSFDRGVEGSYYAKYLDRMRTDGRIGMVPYESSFKVHTAWDIGNDCTCIIFFQTVGQIVRIIDYYENSGSGNGLEHYAKIVLSKDYIYGRHIFPHDMAVTEWGGVRQTRLEKARQLGLNGVICDKKDIDDGIEAVRSAFAKIYIDEVKCAKLIKALENYRQEYDPKKNTYKGYPLHDQFSHAADAMRYLAISLPKTREGTSPEELERRFQEARGGSNMNMPAIFRDDLPPY
jgi:phage terminase large subunit